MDRVNMDYRIEIIEDEDEGGFVAYYPDLPGCITCGETVEDALRNAMDAKEAWLEAVLEQEEIAADEDVLPLANHFLEKNRQAYEMLANPDIERLNSLDAVRETQCAFSGAADELGIMDEDDVQKLVDEIRASETISQKTLDDMDQAVANMKEGIVSPAIDLSEFDR